MPYKGLTGGDTDVHFYWRVVRKGPRGGALKIVDSLELVAKAAKQGFALAMEVLAKLGR